MVMFDQEAIKSPVESSARRMRIPTVILGASRASQLEENLGALAVVAKIDKALKSRIEACFA